MHRPTQVLIPLLFLLFSAVSAQETVVRGKVTDAETGEALAFATVMFTASSTGTTTDIDGRYELATRDMGFTSVTASYVGYEPAGFAVEPGKVNQLDIGLVELGLELETVEVRGRRRTPRDTAATELYRQVVRNKYRNDPGQYDFYRFNQYTKTEFGLYDLSDKIKDGKLLDRFDYFRENIEIAEDGTQILPVLIKETAKEHLYRKEPEKLKTVLLGDRFSGMRNASASDLIGQNFESPEIYGDIILVNGKPLQSPFADNALITYKYFLTDTAVIEGLTCYKLEFTGRGNADAAFTGHAWIHDSTFAIQSIRLTILAGSNINFISDYIVEQRFSLIDGRHWFKSGEFMQGQYNVFTRNGDEKQSFLVRKNDTRSGIEVNRPLPDSLFLGEEVIVQPGAREREEAFWDTVRGQPLTEREGKIFQAVERFKNSALYKGARWMTYTVVTGYLDAKYVEFGRIFQAYSWNAVEGGRIRMGMRTRPEFSERIQLNPYVAYGLKDKMWKYGATVRIHLPRPNENWHMLGLEHYYDLSQLRDDNPILRPNPLTFDNIGLTVTRTEKLKDLFLLRHSAIWYEREWKKGVNTRLAFEHRIHYSAPKGIVFTHTSDAAAVPEDIGSFTTSVLSLGVVYSPALRFVEDNFWRTPMTPVKPILVFDARIGIKGLLGGDYSYNALHIGVRQRLPGPIGYTVYQADAGIVLGRAPYPALTIHPGNQSIAYSKWTYQLLHEGEFISDKYAQLWVIHHFDGKIFDRIPGINKLQFRSLVAFRALVGHMERQNQMEIDLPAGAGPLNGFYAEAGVGIENILKIIRVDSYFRLTQRNKPGIDKWGIRLYISPNF